MMFKSEHHKVHVNSKHFALISNLIYKMNVDRILRRCVNYHVVTYILEACYNNACGGHFFERM